MSTIQCEASACSSTNASGKIFYQCSHCRRWWCSSHGSEGKLCPACSKGYLRK
jgi:hypothetical protein